MGMDLKGFQIGCLKHCKEEVAMVDFELLSVPLQSTLPGTWISLFCRQLLHIAFFLKNPKKIFSTPIFWPKSVVDPENYVVSTIENFFRICYIYVCFGVDGHFKERRKRSLLSFSH
jgi:hypothetical protein